MQRLEDSVAHLRAEQHAMRGDLQRIAESVMRAEARREALEEQDAAVRRLPTVVDRLTARVASLEARQEATERPLVVHDGATPALKDPDVRAFYLAVVTRVSIAAVVIGTPAGVLAALPDAWVAALLGTASVLM